MTGAASTAATPELSKKASLLVLTLPSRRAFFKRSGFPSRAPADEGRAEPDAEPVTHVATFLSVIFTVGHSTRPVEALIALLRERAVDFVVDVRRFPGSRRYPQYGRATLTGSLAAAGIAYRHDGDLGGRRRAAPDSPNTFWRNVQFRGYADHLGTAAARAALEQLAAEEPSRRMALLCAEAVPWRCHRQLIADALVARGVEVLHILAPGRAERHAINPGARVEPDGRIVYPAPA
jgi:hypothetical protein